MPKTSSSPNEPKQPDAFEHQGSAGSSGTVARLRFEFLLPFIAASALLLGIWITLLYIHQRNMVRDEVARTEALVKKTYHGDTELDVRMLEAVMTVIRYDAPLHAALAHRDRAALLRLAMPLSARLKRQLGITHVSFSDAHGVNLLRVHEPNRYGDAINRHITLQAERTGTTSYGVELGPLGFLTLRLVAPWYADNTRQHVIGYVELGMEIGGVLKSVQAFTGTPIVVLISKKHLQRKDWEAGMRMLGRTPNWDRFPDVVLSTQASDNVPASLAKWLESAPPRGPVEARLKAKCRAVFLPLTDVSGRDVGQMVLLIDVAPHIAKTHPAIYIGTIAGTCIVSLLTIFFYLLTGRIGRRIQRDEESLFMLATHDGLTGLYNHRSFYALLEEELARAQRFNRPVSLLMLDIDHFKEVNDTHGHQAGDAVLKGLSERLGRQARIIRVCRYGGEEIAVILPETDLETATNIAERIRASVEAAPFEIGTGEPVRITVSIGSATWPTQANSPSQLVAAADAAMYAAKQEGRNRINHSKTAVEEAS